MVPASAGMGGSRATEKGQGGGDTAGPLGSGEGAPRCGGLQRLLHSLPVAEPGGGCSPPAGLESILN